MPVINQIEGGSAAMSSASIIAVISAETQMTTLDLTREGSLAVASGECAKSQYDAAIEEGTQQAYQEYAQAAEYLGQGIASCAQAGSVVASKLAFMHKENTALAEQERGRQMTDIVRDPKTKPNAAVGAQKASTSLTEEEKAKALRMRNSGVSNPEDTWVGKKTLRQKLFGSGPDLNEDNVRSDVQKLYPTETEQETLCKSWERQSDLAGQKYQRLGETERNVTQFLQSSATAISSFVTAGTKVVQGVTAELAAAAKAKEGLYGFVSQMMNSIMSSTETSSQQREQEKSALLQALNNITDAAHRA